MSDPASMLSLSASAGIQGDRLLTTAELVELTEYTQRSAQLRWLRKNGVRHHVSGRGNPRVWLSAAAGWQDARQRPRVEPDFEALKRA